MNDITRPLRLAVGSHSAGTGKGCAMNLISWENGDTQITDLPACADPVLAKIVQRVNDVYCTHTDGDLLCVDCSAVVLTLAHRTVGTGTLPLTPLERRVIWVKIAVDQARQVLHLVCDEHKQLATDAIEAAERWITDPSIENKRLAAEARERIHAAYAAYAAAYAAYAAAAYAADAADAAYAAYAAYAADDAAYAAYAAYAADATAAAYAADAAVSGREVRLSLANRAFDLFEELASHVQVQIPDDVIAEAYACMTSTARH